MLKETKQLLTLNKQTASYFFRKMGLCGNNKKLQLGMSNTTAGEYGQGQRTKEKNVLLQKEAAFRGAVVNRESIGGNWELEVWCIFIGWVVAREEKILLPPVEVEQKTSPLGIGAYGSPCLG